MRFYPVLLFLFLIAVSLPANAGELMLLPEDNEATPETHKLIWPTDAGVRYELEETTDLGLGWSTAEGYPLEAVGPVQQKRFTPQPG